MLYGSEEAKTTYKIVDPRAGDDADTQALMPLESDLPRAYRRPHLTVRYWCFALAFIPSAAFALSGFVSGIV